MPYQTTSLSNQVISPPTVAVIGGGPAGLMAAEKVAQAGYAVAVYDAMPTVGRKFLLAGKGGLNLTHAEPTADFLSRYRTAQVTLQVALQAFGATALRAWAADLGVETFVANTGRVYPVGMRATPLLRAWLQRLQANNVQFYVRHRWLGWQNDGTLLFETPSGMQSVAATATVLALGGASWPRMGSTGHWTAYLQAQGIAIAPLKPANCGFETPWSTHFRDRFAGQPLKTVALSFGTQKQVGECMVSSYGLEGSLVYAFAADLRDAIAETGSAQIWLDLAPDRTQAQLQERLARPRASRSLSSHLEKTVGLRGVKAGLLWEFVPKATWKQPELFAAAIKRLPITLCAPRPIAEAISTAGGVPFAALNEHLMLRALPGVFCAGEMLDWEAPTGGYLLTACFATGRWAGQAAADWVARNVATQNTR